MRGQIRGLDMGIKNSEDAISFDPDSRRSIDRSNGNYSDFSDFSENFK